MSENNSLSNGNNSYMQLSPNGNTYISGQSSQQIQSPAATTTEMTSYVNHTTPQLSLSSSSSSNCLLLPPIAKPRKYSLPLIYPHQQSPSEYLESSLSMKSSSSSLLSVGMNTNRKRLSQVGIAVSNHLSATIGWKLLASHSEIVRQAKCLCARFIRFKLRKCGLFHKRLNLQKLRSMCTLSVDANTNQVENELRYLTHQLERSHSKVFSSVLNNIHCQTFTSVANVQTVLHVIAQELFRNDITWARIAALYSVMAALAIDCVQIGRPEYVTYIIDTFTTFIDHDIAGWIAHQGGWDSLIYRFRTEDYWRKTVKYTLLSVSILFWAVLAYCLT